MNFMKNTLHGLGKRYKHLPKENIYINNKSSNIGYADGAEGMLLEILNASNDNSCLSDELPKFMSSWPLEYHLSKKRHLIIKNFNIRKGDKVLELGAGCGAITRYLAEIGAEVTAVEGEYSRAQAIAKRCEDFSNVTIVVDNILDFQSSIKYDWILMIGVLEYAPKYGRTMDPVNEYLTIAKDKLNEHGTLLVAIENKIGIKYINGASEDHNGVILYGPQDLYAKNDITTWGRKELVDIFHNSGFKKISISGVFPDYKLPKVIFNENISNHTDFRAEELLLYVKSLDYQDNNTRFFDEALFASSLRKNRLLLDFSNSFLVEARVNEIENKLNDKILAHYFSTDRKSCYSTITKFYIDNDKCYVMKNHLSINAAQPIDIVDSRGIKFSIMQFLNNSKEEYYEGRSLGYKFTQAITSDQHEEISKILIIWANRLVKKFDLYCRKTGEILDFSKIKGRKLAEVLISGQSLDCGPQNIITGNIDHTFDLEWVCSTPIPLSWILYRNINHINRHSYNSRKFLSNENLLGLMADFFEIEAFIGDIEEAIDLESKFQLSVSSQEPSTTIKLVNPWNYSPPPV